MVQYTYKLVNLQALKLSLLNTHLSMYILCGISKDTFEIPHVENFRALRFMSFYAFFKHLPASGHCHGMILNGNTLVVSGDHWLINGNTLVVPYIMDCCFFGEEGSSKPKLTIVSWTTRNEIK